MKKHILHKLLFASVMVAASSFTAQAQGTITTIAGTGTAGFSGDGAAAVDARFSTPSGVAVDGAGNIFIADKNNNKIRKIDASGTISSIAGTGVPGWMATPSLHYPISVFVDGSGEVLFTGWFSDAGFYTNEEGNTYGRFGCGSQGSTGDGGPACLAKTMTPYGACEDNYGNTYIADWGSNRIRRVDAATGIITTIVNATGAHGYAGDGGAALDARTSGLSAVFVDPASPGAGHLYFSEANNNVIRKVDLNTNTITTVAGIAGSAGYTGNWGYATAAKLRSPGSIFIDNTSTLYFCDRGNNVVRAFNLVRKVIYTVAGNGTAGFSGDEGSSEFAQLNNPYGVWVDNAHNMYIADANNQRIRKVTLGTFTTLPKQSGGGVSGAADGIIKVYPNPAHGSFNISVSEDYTNATISILNVLGQEVYNGVLTNQMGQVDLTTVPAGTYTLILNNGSNKHVEKLTLQ